MVGTLPMMTTWIAQSVVRFASSSVSQLLTAHVQKVELSGRSPFSVLCQFVRSMAVAGLNVIQRLSAIRVAFLPHQLRSKSRATPPDVDLLMLTSIMAKLGGPYFSRSPATWPKVRLNTKRPVDASAQAALTRGWWRRLSASALSSPHFAKALFAATVQRQSRGNIRQQSAQASRCCTHQCPQSN